MTDPTPAGATGATDLLGPFGRLGANAARRGLLLSLLSVSAAPLCAVAATAAGSTPPLTLPFRGHQFLHRWSREGQHEFTPRESADLRHWQDMITLNQHAGVLSGEQLASVANGVLGNYQRHGRILQTRSTPRTPQQPAQHLIVAVLGQPQLLEAAFARCLMHEGRGLVAVVSHRVYGAAAGPAMSDWLRAHGMAVERALMDWQALPPLAQLNALPRS